MRDKPVDASGGVATASQPHGHRPWYRQFWPWFLMVFPAAAVIGGIVTFRIAANTDDGVVEDDYYKQGLAVNRTIARDERAGAWGLEAVVALAPDELRVRLRGEPPEWPARLVLKVLHPTRAGRDQRLELVHEAKGRYRTAARIDGGNRWNLILEDEAGRWRLVGILAAGAHEAELRPAQ